MVRKNKKQEIVKLVDGSIAIDGVVQHDFDLLPCPFCGHEAKIYLDECTMDTPEIACTYCEASPNMAYLSVEDVVVTWNKRRQDEMQKTYEEAIKSIAVNPDGSEQVEDDGDITIYPKP